MQQILCLKILPVGDLANWACPVCWHLPRVDSAIVASNQRGRCMQFTETKSEPDAMGASLD